MKKDKGSLGFLQELKKAPNKSEQIKQPFTWQQAVVQSASVSMNTPRRLTEHKAVAQNKSDLVTETKTHIANRRATK